MNQTQHLTSDDGRRCGDDAATRNTPLDATSDAFDTRMAPPPAARREPGAEVPVTGGSGASAASTLTTSKPQEPIADESAGRGGRGGSAPARRPRGRPPGRGRNRAPTGPRAKREANRLAVQRHRQRQLEAADQFLDANDSLRLQVEQMEAKILSLKANLPQKILKDREELQELRDLKCQMKTLLVRKETQEDSMVHIARSFPPGDPLQGPSRPPISQENRTGSNAGSGSNAADK